MALLTGGADAGVEGGTVGVATTYWTSIELWGKVLTCGK